jgi:DNA polymerase-4
LRGDGTFGIGPFELISRSRTVSGKIDSRGELESASAELLRALFPMNKPVRLLGVSISGFTSDETPSPDQQSLEL